VRDQARLLVVNLADELIVIGALVASPAGRQRRERPYVGSAQAAA
jgi:hypothetical protein